MKGTAATKTPVDNMFWQPAVGVTINLRDVEVIQANRKQVGRHMKIPTQASEDAPRCCRPAWINGLDAGTV